MSEIDTRTAEGRRAYEERLREELATTLNESLTDATETLRIAFAGFMRVQKRADQLLEIAADLGPLGPAMHKLEETEISAVNLAVEITNYLEQRFEVQNQIAEDNEVEQAASTNELKGK